MSPRQSVIISSFVYQENSPERRNFQILGQHLSGFSGGPRSRCIAVITCTLATRTAKSGTSCSNYQRDAVTGIINKLGNAQWLDLADSAYLGKTFTALAVVKY